MSIFTIAPSEGIATATMLGERFVTETTAVCRYWLYSMAVYETADGSCYFHVLPSEQMECYPHGQVELVGELEELDHDYANVIGQLRDYNSVANRLGLDVVSISNLDNAEPWLVLCCPATQCYYLVTNHDLERLNEAIVEKLAVMSTSVNSLALPYKVHLDDFGDVVRLEEFEL